MRDWWIKRQVNQPSDAQIIEWALFLLSNCQQRFIPVQCGQQSIDLWAQPPIDGYVRTAFGLAEWEPIPPYWLKPWLKIELSVGSIPGRVPIEEVLVAMPTSYKEWDVRLIHRGTWVLGLRDAYRAEHRAVHYENHKPLGNPRYWEGWW